MLYDFVSIFFGSGYTFLIWLQFYWPHKLKCAFTACNVQVLLTFRLLSRYIKGKYL